MAENEKKTELENSADKKPAKAAKAKSDKPSIWKRIGSWFKSLKSESKKIAWASWKSVRTNGTIVLIAVAIIAIVLGVLDITFTLAFDGLANLIN